MPPATYNVEVTGAARLYHGAPALTAGLFSWSEKSCLYSFIAFLSSRHLRMETKNLIEPDDGKTLKSGSLGGLGSEKAPIYPAGK